MMRVGAISIVLSLDDVTGEELVTVDTDGDLSLVTQLGVLDLARDTLLRPEDD